jgi:hypothetical protein
MRVGALRMVNSDQFTGKMASKGELLLLANRTKHRPDVERLAISGECFHCRIHE